MQSEWFLIFFFFFFFLADDNQNLSGKFRFFLDVGHERKILYDWSKSFNSAIKNVNRRLA